MSVSDKGLLVVLSSPSGGGKTTIYRAILGRHADYLYSVSATTRPPRGNEHDGVDYHFLSEEKFMRKIEAGDFVEWAYVHGHRYGTLKSASKEALEKGAVMLLDLDVQGADSMKKAFPEHAVNIFILPPARVELEKRLRARGTDSPDVIAQRLINAEGEIRQALSYDYLAINDDLTKCIDVVDSIITAELCRPWRVLPLEGWGI